MHTLPRGERNDRVQRPCVHHGELLIVERDDERVRTGFLGRLRDDYGLDGQYWVSDKRHVRRDACPGRRYSRFRLELPLTMPERKRSASQ